MTAAKLKRSVCPYDCPDTCGLIVETAGDKVVRVQGDNEHPFTRGTLCPKMTHYERTVHSPRRLTTPLKRSGPKGSGQFQPITWEQAIAEISANWKNIISAYGAQAILPFSYAGTMGLVQRNSGHPFFYRLGASELVRTICTPAKDYGWKAIMGSTLSPHPDEVINSDFIILWGSNAIATNIHFLQGVREARKRGAKVWLIETYETPTAATVDRVILVRPGSDSALALAIMHVLVRDNLIDHAFINDYVQGFEELRGILPEYKPEVVSEITGLDAAVIEDIAHTYGHAQAPFISVGSGMARYGNGGMTVRTLVALPALVGAWAKRGGGLLTSVSTGSAFDLSVVTREDLKRQTRQINMNQLGDALTTLSDPPIASLYVYHSNPAAVVPDQNKVIAGLEREDLFTVVHERFLTDSALYADIILPATTSLEHSDIYRSYGHYCVQRAFPVIEPVGQSKANWDVFCLLAQAMGFEDEIFKRSADDMIEQLLEVSSPWLASVEQGKLRAGLPVELPLPEGAKLQYKTPSGKIEIYNPREEQPVPQYFAPHGEKADLWLMTAPSVYGLNSSFSERPELIERRDAMKLLMSTQDAADRHLQDGQQIIVYNDRGEVGFYLNVTDRVPSGVVVAEGVWWIEKSLTGRTVNALTSQRLTDKAVGSTFYDTKVNVRAKRAE